MKPFTFKSDLVAFRAYGASGDFSALLFAAGYPEIVSKGTVRVTVTNPNIALFWKDSVHVL